MTYRMISLAAILVLASTAGARFMRPDLEKIPVERLVKNLEELAAKEPKDAQVRFNLARVHAMAYALKTDVCEVNTKQANNGAWFGFTPSNVPFKSVETTDKEKQEAAKKHLEKAIESYREVLKLQANHLPAQLGLAWCVEQSGDKAAAIKEYRAVIETGWEKEGKLKFGSLGGNFITKEAAGYLIPLLDKQTDEKEIAILTERVAQLNKLPRPVTPIAVPLANGLTSADLEDRNASVAFDVDGANLGKRWSWITKKAGWLVFDPHRTGKITSGLQLFGNVSFWCLFDNGYDALRCLDDNGDGRLDGAELDGLALWCDANGNGVCDPGEVRTLAEHGIVRVACTIQIDELHVDRIAFSPRGVTFRDGTTRPTFDLVLRSRD